MDGLLTVAGLLLASGGVVLLAQHWPFERSSGSVSRLPVAVSLALLVGASVLYLIVYGALRGSLIVFFVIGGAALLAALAVELKKYRRG